jgi:mediator of RNA polymerase II transcription subunit 17
MWHFSVALGEMTQARDLLSFLLSSTAPNQASPVPSLPSKTLTATMVSRPPAIISVEAFNAQLTIGGKDEALRKAANVFKQAALRLERGRLNGDKYWVDALKIRKANWGLVPAPLPVWVPTGKGADRSARDFLTSFGLEECKRPFWSGTPLPDANFVAPKLFRRKAVAHMSTHETEANIVVFPHRQRTRLQVSLTITDSASVSCTSHNTVTLPESTSLEASLAAAQREIVDEEIFSVLIREASNLPTASARVAERLIVIDADQGTELRFEMVGLELSQGHPFHQQSRRMLMKAVMRFPGAPKLCQRHAT